MNHADHSAWPAWHNGVYCTSADLRVSVHDYGLTRSHALYEVISVKNNRVLKLEWHLDRFFEGCRHYFIKLNYDCKDLTEVLSQLSKLIKSDLHVTILATRGVPLSYNMSDVLKAKPQCMAFAKPFSIINDGRPLRLTIAKKVRRIPDTSIDQKYKNFARQDFTLASIESTMKGYDYPLLLDHQDFITEGPQFSLAIVTKGKIKSPAKNRLSGVTMAIVKQLCDCHGIDFTFCDITVQDVLDADDVFATTTAGGILPVITIDDCNFLQSETQQTLQELYRQAWCDSKYSTALG